MEFEFLCYEQDKSYTSTFFISIFIYIYNNIHTYTNTIIYIYTYDQKKTINK